MASFANVARTPANPVLIARVCKEVTISDENFDELLGLQENGPVVQHMKKNDDKIVLSFNDKASRDKAKTLLSKGNIHFTLFACSTTVQVLDPFWPELHCFLSYSLMTLSKTVVFCWETDLTLWLKLTQARK